jgi:hypothetical protein
MERLFGRVVVPRGGVRRACVTGLLVALVASASIGVTSAWASGSGAVSNDTAASSSLPVTVSVSPDTGSAGTAVVASGTGYKRGETVKVAYKTKLTTPASVAICSGTAQADHSFSCTGDIPASPDAGAVGTHKLVAKGATSHLKANTTFTLQPTLTSISVIPANQTIAQDQTLAFQASGHYSDGTSQTITNSVSWSSGGSAIASMSGNTATGVNAGNTTITATLGAVVGGTSLNVTCRFHDNGLGQQYSDCNPRGTPGIAPTYNSIMAQEAALAWPSAGAISTAVCGGGSTSPYQVVEDQTSTRVAVWAYTGLQGQAGHVFLNTSSNVAHCPTEADPAWN